jgi:hypothetical protein
MLMALGVIVGGALVAVIIIARRVTRFFAEIISSAIVRGLEIAES